MSEQTLYIIDAHAHIYASYYAIRALSSPAGEPTNAVYGFTNTLLALLRDRRPDKLVVVFDPPGKVFRNEIYDQYKATRDKMPEDLLALDEGKLERDVREITDGDYFQQLKEKTDRLRSRRDKP